MGTSIGLSGMWVLIAVGVGGSLMGVAGMFLMIPVTSVIYTLLSEYTDKRLRNTTVDPKKLEVQPPQIQRFRDRQKTKKEKKQKTQEVENQTK